MVSDDARAAKIYASKHLLEVGLAEYAAEGLSKILVRDVSTVVNIDLFKLLSQISQLRGRC